MPIERSPESFATTRWSMVLRAGKREEPQATDALAVLCEQYWFPLYAYVRRRVADVNEAQDLTQEFFARLLEKKALDQADPERGRFRAFLLTALKHFLANEWDRAKAHKRGGLVRRLSFDLQAFESRLCFEPADPETPERIFERQWALTLLDLVIDQLKGEYVLNGKERQFELLKGALAGERGALRYPDLAVELSMSADAVRQAAHRLRKRYLELLRAEVAHTVAGPEEVEDEIRRLFETLA